MHTKKTEVHDHYIVQSVHSICEKIYNHRLEERRELFISSIMLYIRYFIVYRAMLVFIHKKDAKK